MENDNSKIENESSHQPTLETTSAEPSSEPHPSLNKNESDLIGNQDIETTKEENPFIKLEDLPQVERKDGTRQFESNEDSYVVTIPKEDLGSVSDKTTEEESKEKGKLELKEEKKQELEVTINAEHKNESPEKDNEQKIEEPPKQPVEETKIDSTESNNDNSKEEPKGDKQDFPKIEVSEQLSIPQKALEKLESMDRSSDPRPLKANSPSLSEEPSTSQEKQTVKEQSQETKNDNLVSSPPQDSKNTDPESGSQNQQKSVVQKPAPNLKVIEIHNTSAKMEFSETENGKSILSIPLPESLLDVVVSPEPILVASDEKFSRHSKETLERLTKIFDTQTKIYSKILWVQILSEQLVKENSPNDFKIDNPATIKKIEDVRKLELEVAKTKAFFGALNTRISKTEKDLDDAFTGFLKKFRSQ